MSLMNIPQVRQFIDHVLATHDWHHVAVGSASIVLRSRTKDHFMDLRVVAHDEGTGPIGEQYLLIKVVDENGRAVDSIHGDICYDWDHPACTIESTYAEIVEAIDRDTRDREDAEADAD